jgi:hypothetical protein
MEPNKLNRPAEPGVPRMGIGRDVRRLKADGADAAAELREFVHQLRGKPPQEVLGLVAQSGLIRATALATVGTLVLVAILTVVPYAMAKAFPEKPKAAPAATAEAASDAQSAEAGAADGQTATSPAAGQTGTPAAPGAPPLTAEQGEDLLDALGEGETRESDPTVNPLEESADDLLDELN